MKNISCCSESDIQKILYTLNDRLTQIEKELSDLQSRGMLNDEHFVMGEIALRRDANSDLNKELSKLKVK